MNGTVQANSTPKACAGCAAPAGPLSPAVRMAPKIAAPNAPARVLKKFSAPVATPRKR